MGKKPAVKMSMAELSEKFGGDATGGALPSQSEGKEFGKGQKGGGKGGFGRDFGDGDSRADGDWGRGGKGGGGKGGDRDGGFRRDEPSRSDTGDWFSKDRPAAGGGDDRPRGGGGGFGDRDRGGDRGGGRDERPRRDDRPGKDDGDDNWRAGPRAAGGDDRGGERRGGGGFGDRDRDERPRRDDRPGKDDGDDNWRAGPRGAGGGDRRDDRDERPAERPRLKLLKKGEKKDDEPVGAAAPARKMDEDAKASAPVKSKNSNKSKEKMEDEESDEEVAPARKEEEAPKKYVPPSRKTEQRDDDDEPERREKKAEPASAGGKYVPAHMRKKMDEDKARDDERRARDEDKRARQDAEEEERDRKTKADKKAKEEEKARLKAEKDAKAQGGAAKPVEKAKKAENAGPAVDEEKLGAFAAKCTKVVDSAKGDVNGLVKEVPDLLTETELRTALPVRCLLQSLLSFCRAKEDKQVISAVGRFAPLFKCLIEKSKTWRFKVQLLCEAQKLIFDMGLPRLSPASALIEVFFDGLYQAEVIEEKYFDLWTMHNDDTVGKTKAMFQLNDFLEWLRNAPIEGEEDSEDGSEKGEKEGSDDDDDEEEDEDDDIEANVPKRAGIKPMQR